MPVTDTAEVAVKSAVTSGVYAGAARSPSGQHQQPGAEQDRHQERERHQPHGVAEKLAHQTIFLFRAVGWSGNRSSRRFTSRTDIDQLAGQSAGGLLSGVSLDDRRRRCDVPFPTLGVAGALLAAAVAVPTVAAAGPAADADAHPRGPTDRS